MRVEKKMIDLKAQRIAAGKLTAPDNLEAGAHTYRSRNPLYGDSYRQYGALFAALFPQGLPQGMTAADYNRLGVLHMCLSKLQRYAGRLALGGHRDSAHDLMVYAAMLEELTDGDE